MLVRFDSTTVLLALVALGIPACRHAGAPSEPSPVATPAAEGSGLACVGPGPRPANGAATSVTGEALAPCPATTETGFRRDGYCARHDGDHGAHVVCARVTAAFLDFTKSRGDGLATPRGGFPGLRDGDAWCLCARRWAEALEAGVAPPVLLEATDKSALQTVSREALAAHTQSIR